ncbi:MAG TPA: ATP-binding protein [Ramlibacter sp.]|nr:ATP-binding protein [Ramlibacter sp.]
MNRADPSTRAHSRPLRMRLLLLAASGLVPLLIVLVWGLNYLVKDRQEEAEQSVLELSRALAIAVDAELRSTVTLLEHMGTSDELERADFRGFHLSARRVAEQLGWRQVLLADSEGHVLFMTNRPFGTPSNVIEPASLARVIETLAPVVARVVEGSDQRPETFAVRVPVLRGGKLIYVLTAVLPTEKVTAVLTRLNIPVGSVSAVFDQTGRRVARSRFIASPNPSPSLKMLLDRGDAQGVGRTLTREGEDSYTGYTRLKDSGWVVVVGASVADANTALYPLLGAIALGIAASLALALLLAWWLSLQVVEPIDALKDGAAALGRGDAVELPPLKIVELDDVAVVLVEAAKERDRAAAQVNDALRIAEEANRSKDQFLAMLGHELRNPLAPISTAVQLMAMKGDEKTAPERRIIERQLGHVTRLVDDLLDISRITSGRLQIRHEPVRIGQALAQVVELIRPSLYQRSLSLQLEPGVDDAWVAGDEVRLSQVFSNLLVNAIKFTPAGGSIVVKAAVEGEQLRVEVTDTGIGISPAELERVFDLFYQAPQNSDRAQGGLGLGLPIVKSLVEMHGGSVEAASDGHGRGSSLIVWLPLCAAPAAAEEATPPAVAHGAGRILVVDDNEDAADTCATLLEMSGYTVRVAYSPKAAMEALREFKADVAILDIGLPGMSGYELAARIREEPIAFRGRLVALTGYGQAADMAASRGAGFDAHLTKPVGPTELLELVERLSREVTS